MKEEIAIVAGGCFWGVQHMMGKINGVIHTEAGYIGGHKENPRYEEVKSHTTGHAEAVRIAFDSEFVSYEDILKLFFEIHDPTQEDGQGPDIGPQYRSEIFYINENQKEIAEKVITQLKGLGYKVVTKVTPASTFYIAEDYHQNYYEIKGTEPYCHIYTKRF